MIDIFGYIEFPNIYIYQIENPKEYYLTLISSGGLYIQNNTTSQGFNDILLLKLAFQISPISN